MKPPSPSGLGRGVELSTPDRRFEDIMKSGITYILECANGNFYIGSTDDFNRRFNEHENGKNRSTKHKRPLKVVYTKKFVTLKEARSFEYFIKRQRNKKFYEKLINGAFV